MANGDDSRLVWDLPLRAFHWLLATSILLSWVTAEVEIPFWENIWMPIHYQLGYFTIGLLLFRLVWGVVGPKHARFASFFPGPVGLWRYVTGKAAPAVGHNPLGSLSVIALLLVVAVQAGTGLFTADDVEYPVFSGPYLDAVSSDTARDLSRIHRTNFNFILALVALHLLAIAFYAVVKKRNLVGPMITGRKPAAVVPEGQAIAGSALLRALIVIALAAAAVVALVNLAPPPPPMEF